MREAGKVEGVLKHQWLLFAVGLYLLANFAGWVNLPGVSSGYDDQRWSSVLLLALVAVSGLHLPSPRALYLPFLLLLSATASVLLSSYSLEAVTVFAIHVGLLLLAWRVAVMVRQQPGAVITWALLLLLACVVYACVVAVGIITFQQLGFYDTRELFMGFVNRRFFLQLTTPVLPLLLALLLDKHLSPRLRAGALVGSLSWSMLIWLNDGSGALYALLLGGVLALVLLGWRAVRALAMVTLAVLVAGWLLLQAVNLWFPVADAARNVVENIGMGGRLTLWQRAWEAIVAQPFFGWGPGAYAYFTDVINGHPHNLVLDIGVGYGVIGLTLLVWWLWRVYAPLTLRQRLMQLTSRQRYYAVALTFASLAVLLHACVSGVTVMPMAQIVLVVTLGLWAGVLGASTAIVIAEPTPVMQCISRYGGVFLAASLLLFTFLSYQQRCEAKAPVAGSCAYMPAFWLAYPTSGGIEISR